MEADDALAEAVNALNGARRGDVVMPEDDFGAALDVLEEVAKRAGRTVEDLLAAGDPDPRCYAPEAETMERAFADLDERERFLAVNIAHSIAISSAVTLAADPDLYPSVWSIAHDRAIAETREARR